MDSHGWQAVYQTIRAADREIPRWGRRPKYSDVLIVGMYIWSVAHDRPLCWACDRRNYGSCFRPRGLPSISQFCRRIQSQRCGLILQRMHERLSHIDWASELSFIDGRALIVGAHSKDPHAKSGPWGNRFARGYKLHAWSAEDGRIPVWSVMPLNVSEKLVAAEMLRYRTTDGLVLADGAYDSRHLYDQVEAEDGHLLTPLPKNAGKGHHSQSAARNRMALAWKGIAGYVYRSRGAAERTFAHLSAYGGGLAPLPAWVRTLPRVRRWVGAKLIIYHTRWNVRKNAI